jgi:hypothetical protein
MDAAWQAHFKKYDSIQVWMSQTYAEDIADFRKLGPAYDAHVKPGFSWANLKHLPTGDSKSYTPRDGGLFYWNLLSKAAQARVDRLFIGMFDEYDESTAIMPMSDDVPPLPVRPGVGATFYNGPSPQERGEFVLLPGAEIPLGDNAPCPKISARDFYVQMSGRITFPAPGPYTFSVEGATGDDAMLVVSGTKILDAKKLNGIVTANVPVAASNRDPVFFRLEYRHGTANGTLRLLWESPAMPRQPVPPEALQDAWGRFITNEGKPSDWWLKLTGFGKEMLSGKRSAHSPMPE